MSSFAIITDTVANIDQETADSWGIYLTPYIISLDGQEYIDGVDISTEEFFKKLPKAEDAKTSVPPPGNIMKTIDQAVKDGYDEILAICNGHHYTGMVNAVEMLRGNYPELRIEIFDSQSVTLETGFYALHAKELSEEGKSLDETLEILNKQLDHVVTYGSIKELDHLIKGGRMGKVTGKIGKFLRVSPTLTLGSEAVEIVKPIRGDKKAIQFCADKLKDFLEEHGDCEYYLGFSTGDNQEGLEYAKELFEEEIKNAQYTVEIPVTPVVGIHTGGSVIVINLYIKI